MKKKSPQAALLASADAALAAFGQSPDVTIGKPFKLRLAPTRCTFRSRRPVRTVRARRSRATGRGKLARAPGGDDDPSEPPGSPDSPLNAVWRAALALDTRQLFELAALAQSRADWRIGGLL